MDITTIKRGGLLAGKRRYLLIAATLAGPVINYLAGDTDLASLLTVALQTLAGMD